MTPFDVLRLVCVGALVGLAFPRAVDIFENLGLSLGFALACAAILVGTVTLIAIHQQRPSA